MRPGLLEILRCPRCRGALTVVEGAPAMQVQCATATCGLSREPFPTVSGQVALIDFDNSIVDRQRLVSSSGRSVIGRASPLKVSSRLLVGQNEPAAIYARYIVNELARAQRPADERPRVLVIGGGEMGSGADPLYAASHIDLVGTDIYGSPITDLLADAHALPFADAAFDAVWIEAVLEHVLDPKQVVDETHRVLRPRGLVFADTPFLWPVHEGAFDFTRFTASGHRWLFRGFDQVAAGYSSGAGQNLALALRSAVGGVARNRRIGTAAALLFFWLRFLDRVSDRRANLDSAAGLYFVGRKAEQAMSYREIVEYYSTQTVSQ